MSLHDLLTGRQADAGPWVFVAAMKAPKNIEYLLMVLGSYTDPLSRTEISTHCLVCRH